NVVVSERLGLVSSWADINCGFEEAERR
ncbi:MAG: hypothetical protein ACI83I_002945, partial [Bacteroidia bacterium]